MLRSTAMASNKLMWRNDRPWIRAQWIAGAVAAIGMTLSLYFAKFEFGKGFETGDQVKFWQAVVLCTWILGPPLWFWLEYFAFFERTPGLPTDAWERFKYGQEQSAKIWLALITVLLGLYFGKDFTHESSDSKSIQEIVFDRTMPPPGQITSPASKGTKKTKGALAR